ncbi:unnamed protein product [Boreogadus saida]
MAERTVAQLLREAATALDEQRGVGSATNMPAPDRTGEGRANRGNSCPLPGNGQLLPDDVDKFCTATEFTAILLLNYPALRDCGGYQLLRARGTTRSKCLIPIDCPREGSHQQSTSAAQTSAQSSAAQSSAQSAAQSAAPTSASQSAAPTSAAQSSAQSSAPTSAAQSSAQSSASTSAAQSSAQSSASTSAASTSSTGRVSDICNEEWKLEPDTKAAAKMFQTHLLKDADQKPTLMLTLDMHVTEEDRERAIIGFYKQTNIDWTRPFEVQLKGMLNKTCTYVLYGTSTTPSNTPKMCNPQEFFIVLYMTGDCAIGDGVKKYFFSLCLNKLQTGLNLHLNRPKFTPCKDMGAIDAAVLQLDDCPDLDIVEIVSLLESQTVLTPENVDQVNHLALSWDLPNLTENNRRLLGQQILHHGVIVRRERQMAQLRKGRKGLKDTRVLQMLKERPELASALFPRSAEAELEPEMIIERIVWPEPDSDEEEEIDEYCSVVAYLRQYISLASSSELQQLIEFWTGWAVLPDELYVSVDRDATYPTASTCFTTLKIPTGCGSYRDFCFKLGAAVSTTKFGFGRI